MEISKEISQDNRKRIVDLQKSGSSFGIIGIIRFNIHLFKQLCPTIIPFIKETSPGDEHALVRKVLFNHRTKEF